MSFEAGRGQRGKVDGSETLTIRGPAEIVFLHGLGTVQTKSESRLVQCGTLLSIGYQNLKITATKQDVPGLFVQEISFLVFRPSR